MPGPLTPGHGAVSVAEPGVQARRAGRRARARGGRGAARRPPRRRTHRDGRAGRSRRGWWRRGAGRHRRDRRDGVRRPATTCVARAPPIVTRPARGRGSAGAVRRRCSCREPDGPTSATRSPGPRSNDTGVVRASVHVPACADVGELDRRRGGWSRSRPCPGPRVACAPARASLCAAARVRTDERPGLGERCRHLGQGEGEQHEQGEHRSGELVPGDRAADATAAVATTPTPVVSEDQGAGGTRPGRGGESVAAEAIAGCRHACRPRAGSAATCAARRRPAGSRRRASDSAARASMRSRSARAAPSRATDAATQSGDQTGQGDDQACRRQQHDRGQGCQRRDDRVRAHRHPHPQLAVDHAVHVVDDRGEHVPAAPAEPCRGRGTTAS